MKTSPIEIYPLPLIKTKSTLVVSKSTIVSALAFLPGFADKSLESNSLKGRNLLFKILS
jgi:hypothetical protein